MNKKSSPSISRLLRIRRTCQIAVALLFIGLPLLNTLEFHALVGNFFSFSLAGIPLADPLSVAQAGWLAKEVTQTMLWGAGLVFLLAFALGSVFCSWVCPFGLLSELAYGRSMQKTQQNIPVAGQQPQMRVRQKSFGYGVYGKFFFTTVGFFVSVGLFAQPLLNQFSMPGWYSRLWQGLALHNMPLVATALSCLGVVLLLDVVLKQRFWCRYLCPQSVLITLPKLLNPISLRVGYERSQCTFCKGELPCNKACSLLLDPRSPATAQRLACTNCGQCVTACSSRGGALSYTLKPPVSHKKTP